MEDDQARVHLAQRAVKVLERLEQELHLWQRARWLRARRGARRDVLHARAGMERAAHSVRAELAILHVPWVHAEDRVQLGRTVERREQRRVVVQPEGLAEPVENMTRRTGRRGRAHRRSSHPSAERMGWAAGAGAQAARPGKAEVSGRLLPAHRRAAEIEKRGRGGPRR
eukprot:scaffold38126_cov27-Tisochrysis_lutea.AAC.2